MPYHQELRYGTPQHSKIRDAVVNRFRSSKRTMSKRYEAWTKAENVYLSYRPEKEEELTRRKAQEKGSNTYAQLTIPYSYATLLTAHTYWTSVFLARDPVLQYTGRHGESQQKVQAVEALVDYQIQVGAYVVPLYLWLLDAGKYGVGILGTYYAEEVVKVASIQDVPVMLGGLIRIPGKTKRERVEEVIPGYSGTKVYNIRPFDFFPDPKVSLTNFQQGEFCGRIVDMSLGALRGSSEGYFNLDMVRETMNKTPSIMREQGSTQIELPEKATDFQFFPGEKSKDNFTVLEMVWDLVPSEWGLGDSDTLEKWVVTVVEETVVVGCRPQGMYHNKFPYLLQTYEMEGYSHMLRGMMELLGPLNGGLDWLLNSHFFNVRKALNDQWVIDPSKIVLKDLLDGGPGRLIRMHPSAYGTDVRTAISQLPTTDVTRGHIADAEILMQMMQRITGVTDNVMGMVGAGGRKTATEVRTSTSFGVNRLKTFTEYNSSLGWAPLSQIVLQNSQQYYDMDQQFKVAGDLMRDDPQFLQVSPDMIAGFYDFVPVDGTLPVDRFAQANLWKEILTGLYAVPQIAMSYDLGGIFAWMAQLAGLKNITQFRVMPDQQLAQQVQAGNMVPNGQAPGVSNIAGGSPANQVGVNGPGLPPGLG